MLVLVFAGLLHGVMHEPSAEVAAEFQAAAARIRREDRWAAAEQPPAVESEKRAPSQRWRAYAEISEPAGGRNSGRKAGKIGPFHAATQAAAESMRDKQLDDWLHVPPRAARRK